MGSAILTSPPAATARLTVDTDVASPRGSEPDVSIMIPVEMRRGAPDAMCGPRFDTRARKELRMGPADAWMAATALVDA